MSAMINSSARGASARKPGHSPFLIDSSACGSVLWLSTSRTPPSEPFDAIDAVRYTFSFITGPLPDHSRLEETCRSFLTTSLSSSDYLDEVLGRLSLLGPCESKSICFRAWS